MLRLREKKKKKGREKEGFRVDMEAIDRSKQGTCACLYRVRQCGTTQGGVGDGVRHPGDGLVYLDL